MKKHIYKILIIIFLLTITFNLYIYSNSKYIRITIDNKHIQSYRNEFGIWILNNGYNNPKRLIELAQEYETTTEKIKKINDNNLQKKYLFIPYGESYLTQLLKQGAGRRIFEIEPKKLLWPVDKIDFTSRYGQRFNQLHTGLDMAVPVGTPVVAAEDGIIKKTGWMGGYGYTVIIQHYDGKETLYAHLSAILLEENEPVKMGQIIALSGNTGRSTGPHLHFEVRYENITLNPEDFLPESYFRSDIIIKEGHDGIIVQQSIPNNEEFFSNSKERL